MAHPWRINKHTCTEAADSAALDDRMQSKKNKTINFPQSLATTEQKCNEFTSRTEHNKCDIHFLELSIFRVMLRDTTAIEYLLNC